MKPFLESRITEPTEYHETAETIVFLHGWPDGPELWDYQVQYLSRHFRCVQITLPNFSGDRLKQGFDFPQIVEALFSSITDLQQTQMIKPIILVGHDWGAYLAYLFESRFPNAVSRMITMDVGARLHPNNLGEALTYGTYQGWLILAWWMGRYSRALANAMSRGLATLGHAPDPAKVSFEMNYLYFYFWRNLLLKSNRGALLKGYDPQTPVLFLYGQSKIVMFHSKEWEAFLQRKSNSRVVGIRDASHWIMRDQPELTNKLMTDWLLATCERKDASVKSLDTQELV